jgi:hypothetical protein
VDPATRRVDLIYLFDLAPGTAVTPRSDEIEQARWSDTQDAGLSPATRQALVLLAEHESARGQGSVLPAPPSPVGDGRPAGIGVAVVDLSAGDVRRFCRTPPRWPAWCSPRGPAPGCVH